MSSPLTELIGRGEGDYNSYNRGTHKGSRGEDIVIPANLVIDFSKMTIDELRRRQGLRKDDPDVVFAVGKYQFIPKNLRDGIRYLNIDASEKFTPELQDRLFNEYLVPFKRPEIKAYITQQPGATLHDAQIGISKEWASVEDPDTPGHVRKEYEKHGNKMHTTAAQVSAALDEMRAEYKAQIDKGLSAELAWQATANMGPGQFQHIAKAHVPGHRIAGDALAEGARGAAVGELQTQLRDLGYADAQGRPLTVDNDFGQNTRVAVEAFQREHGLSANGTVDPHTRTTLREATRIASIAASLVTVSQMAPPAMSTDAIQTLQQQLQTLGVTDHRGQPLPVTGAYDDATRTAVTMFQQEQGLPGTGVLDPATRALIDARATIAGLQHAERGRPVPLHDASWNEGIRMPTAPRVTEPNLSWPTATADGVPYLDNVAVPRQISDRATSASGSLDPRHASNPQHALYNELKTRIPEASEQRLLQFTAACHMNGITDRNLDGVHFDREGGFVHFGACNDLVAKVASVDVKQPSPQPEQSFQQIQQHDQHQMQLQIQIQAQIATQGQAQQGPAPGGRLH